MAPTAQEVDRRTHLERKALRDAEKTGFLRFDRDSRHMNGLTFRQASPSLVGRRANLPTIGAKQAASELSVAELERMLSNRRKSLDSLTRERDELRRRLEIVEGRIAEIEGVGNGRSPAPGRSTAATRAMNSKSLHMHVVEILARSKDGLALAELATAILDTGYKTHSTNFKNVLYQCLYNSKDVRHDASTGTYKLVS